MNVIASVPLTPETITAGLGLVAALIQTLRARNYKAAAETLVSGIETAAQLETDPKRAVKMQAAGAAAKVIDSILSARGWLKAGK